MTGTGDVALVPRNQLLAACFTGQKFEQKVGGGAGAAAAPGQLLHPCAQLGRLDGADVFDGVLD